MFKLVKDIFNTAAVVVPLDGSTNLSPGQVVYRDTTNAVVKAATSSVGTTLNIFGVVVGDPGTTDTSATVIPLIAGPGQIWEADTTNSTAANQLLKAQALTDALTVANTSTHIATTLGVFVPTTLVGAAADKKLQGFFVFTGQVTA